MLGNLRGDAIGLHVGQCLVQLAVQIGVVLAQAHAIVFGAEVVVEHGIDVGLLGHVVPAHHLIDHHGIQAAGGQVHQGGHVVAKGLDVLERLEDGLVLLDGVHGTAAFLGADHLAGQISLGLDGGVGGHHDDLVVFHVGRGEQDVLLALFGDGQAVPQCVHALARELGFLGAPVDGLEFHFQAQALGGFLGHVDVKADQLVLLVAKTHGREVVVQADDDFGDSRWRGCGGGCGGLLLGATSQHGAQGQQGNSGNFFHGVAIFLRGLRTRGIKGRPTFARWRDRQHPTPGKP